MDLAPNAVVLVADGRKLLFLRNEGDAVYPNLTVEMAEEHPNPATRDQATEAAPRPPAPAVATSVPAAQWSRPTSTSWKRTALRPRPPRC